MPTVKSQLSKVKANAHTFKGMDARSIDIFKKDYADLKKYEDHELTGMSITLANQHLKDEKLVYPYVKKLKAIYELRKGVVFPKK